MDKTLAGLIGAVGALAVTSPGHAAPVQPNLDEAMQAASYADLLKPIPNASALLQQSDARAAAEAKPEVMQVQYWAHHHHHHHAYYRRPYYHHHHHHAYYRRPYYHHHHHHRAAIIVPGVGIVVR